MKKIFIIGIGGIGISALARFYKSKGYEVYGSDSTLSPLIVKLQKEGINIKIGIDETRINDGFHKVIYTEAIPKNHPEYIKAQQLSLHMLSYPQALGEISDKHKLIAIAGTHGKSTTTSMTGIILKDSPIDYTAIVGTILEEFGGKNYFHRNKGNTNEYFLVEACEYKRSFLKYNPYILAITNIEVDHLDYYKDEQDYISAYSSLIQNVKKGGFVILNKEEKNSSSLIATRTDVNFILIESDHFIHEGERYTFPHLELQIPGDHLLYDARLAYIIAKLAGVKESSIIKSLESYKGAWRRMEKIGFTDQNNLVISDYGHHPTEIIKTLSSLKESYPNKYLLTIFQPHQYSRTIELLDGFKKSFTDTDILIIPNIYESRDSDEDKQKINPEKLISLINHNNKYNGDGFENTIKLVKNIEKKYNSGELIILLLGAGDVDNLRNSLI